MKEIALTRSIPVRYEADVAVIGGGIAGVCAACSAARSGAKVVLCENFAVVGGNMTTGGVTKFCGETAGQGEVFDEIIEGLLSFGAIDSYHPYGSRYDPARKPEAGDGRLIDTELLSFVLQEILLKRGVKLLLHTRFVDLIMHGNTIAAAIVCGASGSEAVTASHYIDCTGEAQVACRAGFGSMKGRDVDGLQLPMSFKLYIEEMDEGGTMIPDGWIDPILRDEDLPMTSPNRTLYPGRRAVKIKIPLFDSTDTESMSEAEMQGRRRAIQIVEYFNRAKGEHWRVSRFSPRIGIREGRRIIGDYTLTLPDLRAACTFEDAVARGVYYLDGHKPDDHGRTYILSEEERYVPPYQIPFRSLIARDGDNLFMAGRCFSADQAALSSARVSTTCAMMGQAAGIGAAIAADRRLSSHAVDGREVRRVVEKRNGALEV